jgi:AraC-like DNA-binding protein
MSDLLGGKDHPMIHVFQRLRIGATAGFEQVEYRAPGVAFIHVRHHGCRFRDLSTLRAASPGGWGQLDIFLGGEAGLRLGNQRDDLRAGDGYVAPEWGAGVVHPRSSDVESLRILFRRGGPIEPAGGGSFRLGATFASGLKEGLARGTDPRATANALLRRCEAAGLFATAGREALGPPPPATAQLLARAISTQLLPLHTHAGPPDLARVLGWSERSVIRASSAYFRTYFPAGIESWRSYVRLWRLSAAATGLSVVDESIEAVARHAGFGSAVALCHALKAVGWPTPATLREELKHNEREAGPAVSRDAAASNFAGGRERTGPSPS